MPQTHIEFADRVSRRRAYGTAAAAAAFLAVQVIVRPGFGSDGYATAGWRAYAWLLNAILLLCLLLPIGGFIFGKRVRELVNDEVSRTNARAAAAFGFWVAMLIGIVVYLAPPTGSFAARQAIYLVVMPTSVLAPLAFAWLESRAHRGG